jgi:bacillithiol system protein YtxJ
MVRVTTRKEAEEVLRKPLAVLFKHSPICPISSDAAEEVEDARFRRADEPFYLVDVIAHRSVSRFIAERTGVEHESPQALVVVNGVVVWHGSHHDVTARGIERSLPPVEGSRSSR